MTDGFPVWRIGSVGEVDSPVTVIEVEGMLYPLADLLVGEPDVQVSGAPTVRQLLDDWDAWLLRLNVAATSASGHTSIAADEQLWLPPIVFPDKLICVGANYTDHLKEMGVDTSKRASRPYAFLKPTTTGLIGDGVPIIAPSAVTWLDWEGELGVVIGRRARDVSVESALDIVAGYLPFNDVSARDWMHELVPALGMDWILHKSFDNFSPAGRLLTPAHFVLEPQNLAVRTIVNRVVKQDSNTSRMVFTIREIIAHLSSVMTLVPGDIIATGTPAGVGFGGEQRERLQNGDIVRVEIEGLGSITSPVRDQVST